MKERGGENEDGRCPSLDVFPHEKNCQWRKRGLTASYRLMVCSLVTVHRSLGEREWCISSIDDIKIIIFFWWYKGRCEEWTQ
jgi:hypothetical protein